MPYKGEYKDWPERAKRFKRARNYRRRRNMRLEWIAANGPCRHCGSTERLEIDHIDPSTKQYKPNTLWKHCSKAIRDMELAKCQVLCHSCHWDKTRKDYKDGKIQRVSRMSKSLNNATVA